MPNYSYKIASSAPRGPLTLEERNVFAIYVSYYIKVKLTLSGMGGEVTLKLPFILGHVDDSGLTKTSKLPPTQSQHNCSGGSQEKIAVDSDGGVAAIENNEDEHFCVTIEAPDDDDDDDAKPVVATTVAPPGDSAANECHLVNSKLLSKNTNADILEFDVIDEQQSRSDETSICLPSMRHNSQFSTWNSGGGSGGGGSNGDAATPLESNVNVVTAQVHTSGN